MTHVNITATQNGKIRMHGRELMMIICLNDSFLQHFDALSTIP